MTEPTKPGENKIKTINKEAIGGSAPSSQPTAGVEQRIAYMETMQKFQLLAKKRSRPFWKKMLSIK